MLAIIIPYYKIAFFEQTLQSLANQTNQNFKVYIGDDASPEDCSNLLHQFTGKFDFTYHRFENNLGGVSLTKQWERCIALSNQEPWLMLLGDDDVLGENVVEEFYKNYNAFKLKSNVVRLASALNDYNKKNISSVYQHPKWEKASDFYFRRFKGKTRSSLSEYFFRRTSYMKFGFRNYPLAWHSDDMAWIDFADNKTIFTLNEAIIIIGFSDISLSGMVNNIKIKHQATEHFYKDLIKEKLKLFSKAQRLELLLSYEVLIKKSRKLIFSEWMNLYYAYLINFSFIPFLKFNKRIFTSIFSK